MRRSRTISLPKWQYHSLQKQRISLIKSREERVLRNCTSALFSLLFYRQFRICITNTSDSPVSNSPIRTSHTLSSGVFCVNVIIFQKPFYTKHRISENHALAIDNHMTVWYNIITTEHGGVNACITAVSVKRTSNKRSAAKNGRD